MVVAYPSVVRASPANSDGPRCGQGLVHWTNHIESLVSGSLGATAVVWSWARGLLTTSSGLIDVGNGFGSFGVGTDVAVSIGVGAGSIGVGRDRVSAGDDRGADRDQRRHRGCGRGGQEGRAPAVGASSCADPVQVHRGRGEPLDDLTSSKGQAIVQGHGVVSP